VTQYANQVTEALGYYPVIISLDNLADMKTYSTAVLFMGLIFDIIILLFVIIAILLIYSLLMISVETKTFEMGVIRMLGLSNAGIISMVLLQALMFVVPAILLGFAAASPALKVIYS
jgi:ABC-type antimicrobial peptide transport system permease subunit